MTYSDKNHDIFFKKPFWTASNRRFFIILALTTVMELAVITFSIGKFSRLPAPHSQLIKQKYLAQFLKSNADETRPVISIPRLRSQKRRQTKRRQRPGSENKPTFSESTATTVNLLLLGINQINDPRDEAGRNIIEITKNESDNQNTIRAAVNKAPGRIKVPVRAPRNPLKSFLDKRKSSQQNIRIFNSSTQGKVNLLPADFTNFEIPKGYRSQEQILVASSKNAKFIRHCLEKFYGKDPTAKGNIVVKFDIHPDGYVIPESIKIIRSDISDPEFLRCIRKNISRWRNFPKVAVELGDYTITQKYVF